MATPSGLAFCGRSRHLTFLLAVCLTPLLHGWSFAPQRLAWLAWIAFIPWFAAIRIASARGAIALTCLTTLLGAYAVADWLPDAVATYYLQGQVVGLAMFFGVWAVSVAPYVVLFTCLYRAAARRLAATLPLVGGAAWAGCEMLRVRTLVGDPFGLFGYSQSEVLPLMQLTAVTGIYGVSFLLAAVNIALAELWVTSIGGSGRADRSWKGAGAVVGLVLVSLSFGDLQLSARPPEADNPVSVPVVIVQGNLDLGSQWRQELYGQNLEAYLRLSWKGLQGESAGESREPGAPVRDPARLVVWPESAMTFFLEEEPLYRTSLASLFGPFGIELLAGGPRSAGVAPDQVFFNSAFLVQPSGEIRSVYDKQRLLPFAEYFPFGGVALLRRQFARVREFTPGAAAELLPTAAGEAGVVICNEVMFGEIATARVAAGAEWLVNLANDSWLGRQKYAEQAFDMARARAIEQRRYLVRASTSGPSAIVDPAGRVLARSSYDTATTLRGRVAPRSERSVYSVIGDLFAMVCLMSAVGCLFKRQTAA
jgi:apolipoprotein N-acyltransferase